MIGQTIGKYSIVDRLGHGKHSVVYKAIHKQTEETVALKHVPSETLARYPQSREKIGHEIKALLLINHPNVVRLKDYFENSKGIYVVMEYCEGGTLTQLVEKEKGLGEDRSVILFRQLLQAYEAVNLQGVVHRDIKPDNVLIQLGNLVLADFDLSKILEDDGIMYSMAGTPITSAPEILANPGCGYTSKCDIWSLGCVFYYMIFGQYHAKVTTFSSLIHFNLMHTGSNLTFPLDHPLTANIAMLLRSLITPNPHDRMGWDELKSHVLFAERIVEERRSGMLESRYLGRGGERQKVSKRYGNGRLAAKVLEASEYMPECANDDDDEKHHIVDMETRTNTQPSQPHSPEISTRWLFSPSFISRKSPPTRYKRFGGGSLRTRITAIWISPVLLEDDLPLCEQ